MNRLLFLLLLLPFSIKAQMMGCYDYVTYPQNIQKICEIKQIQTGCKADSIVVFSQNGYESDTLINGRICKFYHKPILIKCLQFVPIYSNIEICRYEITGQKVISVFTDCK